MLKVETWYKNSLKWKNFVILISLFLPIFVSKVIQMILIFSLQGGKTK